MTSVSSTGGYIRRTGLFSFVESDALTVASSNQNSILYMRTPTDVVGKGPVQLVDVNLDAVRIPARSKVIDVRMVVLNDLVKAFNVTSSNQPRLVVVIGSNAPSTVVIPLGLYRIETLMNAVVTGLNSLGLQTFTAAIDPSSSRMVVTGSGTAFSFVGSSSVNCAVLGLGSTTVNSASNTLVVPSPVSFGEVSIGLGDSPLTSGATAIATQVPMGDYSIPRGEVTMILTGVTTNTTYRTGSVPKPVYLTFDQTTGDGLVQGQVMVILTLVTE